MIYWKPCPKCQTGTLRLSGDQWGNYLRCINCGLTSDLPNGCTSPEVIRSEIARLHRHFAGEEAAKVASATLAA